MLLRYWRNRKNHVLYRALGKTVPRDAVCADVILDGNFSALSHPEQKGPGDHPLARPKQRKVVAADKVRRIVLHEGGNSNVGPGFRVFGYDNVTRAESEAVNFLSRGRRAHEAPARRDPSLSVDIQIVAESDGEFALVHVLVHIAYKHLNARPLSPGAPVRRYLPEQRYPRVLVGRILPPAGNQRPPPPRISSSRPSVSVRTASMSARISSRVRKGWGL